MEVGQLYQFVLLIVLVGMLLGVGILTLNKFTTAVGASYANPNVSAGTNAYDAINSTAIELGKISSTWLSIIVTVAVLAIILTLVLRSFGGARK